MARFPLAFAAVLLLLQMLACVQVCCGGKFKDFFKTGADKFCEYGQVLYTAQTALQVTYAVRDAVQPASRPSSPVNAGLVINNMLNIPMGIFIPSDAAWATGANMDRKPCSLGAAPFDLYPERLLDPNAPGASFVADVHAAQEQVRAALGFYGKQTGIFNECGMPGLSNLFNIGRAGYILNTSPYCLLQERFEFVDTTRKHYNTLRDTGPGRAMGKLFDKTLDSAADATLRFGKGLIVPGTPAMKHLKGLLDSALRVVNGLSRTPVAPIKNVAKYIKNPLKVIGDTYDKWDKKCQQWSSENGYKARIFKISSCAAAVLSLINVVPQMMAAFNVFAIEVVNLNTVVLRLQSRRLRRRLAGQAPDESLYHVYRRALDQEAVEGANVDSRTAEVLSRWTELHRDTLLAITSDNAVDEALQHHNRSLSSQGFPGAPASCMTTPALAIVERLKDIDGVLSGVSDTLSVVMDKAKGLADMFAPVAGFFGFIAPVLNIFEGLVDAISFLECPDLGPFNFICDLVRIRIAAECAPDP